MTPKRLIALALLCLPFALAAQKKDKGAMKAASSITAEDMKKHLYTIASKEMEGRIRRHQAWRKQAVHWRTF